MSLYHSVLIVMLRRDVQTYRLYGKWLGTPFDSVEVQDGTIMNPWGTLVVATTQRVKLGV